MYLFMGLAFCFLGAECSEFSEFSEFSECSECFGSFFPRLFGLGKLLLELGMLRK